MEFSMLSSKKQGTMIIQEPWRHAFSVHKPSSHGFWRILELSLVESVTGPGSSLREGTFGLQPTTFLVDEEST